MNVGYPQELKDDRQAQLVRAREELDRAIRHYAELSKCSPQRVVVELFKANTNRATRRGLAHPGRKR
jgi:hypothetical protein